MKIIEIKNTSYGEVAYIFDEHKGRVIKIMVDDYTGIKGRGEEEFDEQIEEEIEEEVPRVRKAIVKKPIQRRVPKGEITIDDIPDEMFGDEPKNKRVIQKEPKEFVAPDRKRNSIIPPHLRGMFIKPGQPGASEETRLV